MSGSAHAATAAALCAFAANSVLCRLALRSREVDPASFTSLRLLSGAVVLALLTHGRAPRLPARVALGPALALALYAFPFSYAYVALSTGTGALLLFFSVQVSMLGWGVAQGERPRPRLWLGLLVALGGLLGLTLPGLSAPDPGSALLMVVSGVGWGAYSLLGRRAGSDPLRATAVNFRTAVWIALPVTLVAILVHGAHCRGRGLVLACLSGGLASGLGYSVWYYALRTLSASRAAVLQLLVPVLAAAAGVLWLGEPMSLRLIASALAILGGVALARR